MKVKFAKKKRGNNVYQGMEAGHIGDLEMHANTIRGNNELTSLKLAKKLPIRVDYRIIYLRGKK